MARRRQKSLGGIAIVIVILALMGRFCGHQPLNAPGGTRVSSAGRGQHANGATHARATAREPEATPQGEDARATLRVRRVVDGDTIEVIMNGVPTKVRLIGVDTPETVHPRKPVEFYGREASRFTKGLLTGREVRLEYERGGMSKDRYGRVLAYVYREPDGLFVNAEIVRLGYGHAYTRYPFKYMDQFRQYEREAREAGRGLWEGKK